MSAWLPRGGESPCRADRPVRGAAIFASAGARWLGTLSGLRPHRALGWRMAGRRDRVWVARPGWATAGRVTPVAVLVADWLASGADRGGAGAEAPRPAGETRRAGRDWCAGVASGTITVHVAYVREGAGHALT